MTSAAFSVQGTGIFVEIAGENGATATISGATAANPGVITATDHDILDGMKITITGVVGMTELNGNTYYVNEATDDTFTLLTLDGQVVNTTGFTAYTSGGTATPVEYAQMCEGKTFNFADGKNSEIDTTTICSVAKEYLIGIPDSGEFSIEMNMVPFDDAIVELRAAKLDLAARNIRLSFPNGNVATFRAFIKSVPFQGGVDEALKGSVDMKITGPMIWIE
jgi:hypothetical protein